MKVNSMIYRNSLNFKRIFGFYLTLDSPQCFNETSQKKENRHHNIYA